MKRILVLLGILLSATSGTELYSQGKQVNNKSLLWKISGKNMSRPSYLFGTIHMICKDQYIWTKTMNKCFEACDEVCMEMDMDDPSILMQVAAGVMETDGKHLRDYFNETDYQLVEKYFEDSMGINIAMFSSMKPIVLQTLLAPTGKICDSTRSYEVEITALAQKASKEVTGLESPAEQLKLLDEIPTDSIIKELIDIASGTYTDMADNQALIDAYVKQDLPALYDLIQKSKEQGDNLDAFLDTRNEKWIDRMAERMDQKSVFFAVGAGHLWGEKGLINLLMEQGYVVEPQR